jgi:threonylcarbamoyladenosine tRNA methylthiotransferase MtaB
VDGIERYRISSIEPNLLTDDIIRYCASSRAFMPHFHIPLQSGSDEVLRLMKRRYDTSLFRSKVERVLELMPDAYIGVDVIVGTRGETDALFEDAYRFMEALPVSEYHVFSYSERPGTKALEIPHSVAPEVKHQRSQRIIALSDEKMRAFYGRYEGCVRPVLLEHSRKEGVMYGFTDNYIRVEYRYEKPSKPEGLEGNVVDMRLLGVHTEQELLVAARLLNS